MLAEAGRAPSRVVLMIDVPEDELVQRLSGRRCLPACGKGYNVVFDPPQHGGRLRRLRRRRSSSATTTTRRRCATGSRSTAGRPSRWSATTPRRASSAEVFGGGRMPDEVFEQVTDGPRARAAGVIVRKSEAEIDRIGAAGAVLADCLDLLQRSPCDRASRRASSTSSPRRTSASTAACRPSSATAASRRRSAPRPTTWSCTASRAALRRSPRATSSASTWASRSTASSPTRPSRSPIGTVDAEARRLMDVTARVARGGDRAVPGRDVGWATSRTPSRRSSRRPGFSVVRSLVGHGVGRDDARRPADPQLRRARAAARGSRRAWSSPSSPWSTPAGTTCSSPTTAGASTRATVRCRRTSSTRWRSRSRARRS